MHDLGIITKSSRDEKTVWEEEGVNLNTELVYLELVLNIVIKEGILRADTLGCAVLEEI